MTRRTLVVALCASLLGRAAFAQTPVDSSLAAYIDGIQAIDSHAHPMLPVPSGAPPDTDFDALPLDGVPPFPLQARLRPDNPEWRDAQRALYGVTSTDTGAAYRDALASAQRSVAQREGAHFPEWVLDRSGIDEMMANRIALGPGLSPPRFRWVAFDDALMLPLDTRAEASRTPDTRSLYPKETTLLRRYMRDLGLRALPTSLEDYVARVVAPTLERQRAGGAVSIKFEAAYLRPLDFDDPDPVLARRVYARYVSGGTPTHVEYKALEDYLFRVIVRQAGRDGMSVQIHCLETYGGFYDAAGSAPHLLEPALDDSTLRGTTIILIHGGWPLIDETQTLLAKPNVYTDISAMTLILEPAELARVLRQWLGEWPDKVLFGTDAFDDAPAYGWAESAWLGTRTARRALAMALTGMMRDGEIDRTRAEQLARMVMRDNAVAAYHLHLD
ncbi:MAG TPA: hypothetical protein VFW04_19205 [Gemmatimonadaceae bacterium]|nr:hypothetical protein [Gemmatimonadaceae bacterium]